MINVCVICMVNRPPLSPLSAEHRTLLEAIVSPVINTADFQAFHCQWLICDTCILLMQRVYNFQQTALVGIKNILLYLKTGPTVIEETKPLVDIKAEPTPEVSPAEVASKDVFITIEAPRNVNLLTEELVVKFEPEPPDSEHEPEVADCDTVSSASSESNHAPSLKPATSISAPNQQVRVPNTQQFRVPNTQQFGVPNTQQLGVPNTQQFGVPNTQQFEVPNTQQFGVLNTQQFGVPNTQQFGVPNTQQFGVPNTQQFGVPNTQQFGVPNIQQFGVPNTQLFRAPNTQQFRVPNTQQLLVQNTQQFRFPNTQQFRVPNTQQFGVPNSQQFRASKTQQFRVPKTKQIRAPNTRQFRVPNTQEAQVTPVTAVSEGNFEVFTHQQPNRKIMGSRGPRKKYIRKKPPDVTCPHCEKSFRGDYNLRMHMTRLHGEISLSECDVCGKQCRNEMALKYHKYNHVKQQRKSNTIDDMRPELFCKECCKQFASSSSYRTHLSTRKHTPKERYTFECDTCKAKFLDEKRRQQHIDIVHLCQKEFKCEKCDKSYGSEKAVQRHIISVHEKRPSAKPPSICHLCGKTFTVRKSLREHLLMHEGLRPHQCPLCPATFTYEAALYTHNRLKHLKIKRKLKKKKKVEKNGEKKEKEGEENGEESYDADGVGELLKII